MVPWSGGLASRDPAVAGMFYPANAARIDETLDQWFGASQQREKWRAALVPHAGWVYSGRIAAEVLNRVEMPGTIVILCPKHHAGGAECAIAPWQRWVFPGGSLQADVALSRRLAEQVAGLVLDDRPHRQEHAIEVQLPLLARLAPHSRIVSIAIGHLDLPDCETMADQLAETLHEQLDDLLWIISSDMNHFASDDENRRLDALALGALEQLDPQQLYTVCRKHRITMCGMLPAVIVLTLLRHRNLLHEARQVAYDTSAAASGDRSRVVGYAGMLFR